MYAIIEPNRRHHHPARCGSLSVEALQTVVTTTKHRAYGRAYKWAKYSPIILQESHTNSTKQNRTGRTARIREQALDYTVIVLRNVLCSGFCFVLFYCSSMVSRQQKHNMVPHKAYNIHTHTYTKASLFSYIITLREKG